MRKKGKNGSLSFKSNRGPTVQHANLTSSSRSSSWSIRPFDPCTYLWCIDLPMSKFLVPQAFRAACREGTYDKQSSGQCPGFVQANLTILPKALAFDFLLFCHRNPKACPVLDVTDPGIPTPLVLAKSADLRKDLPMYRVYRDGQLDLALVTDIEKYWRSDLVSFLTGCSYSFEDALVATGIPVRHVEEDVNVPMFITNIACSPSGPFKGPLVVSMRPMTPLQAITAVRVTDKFRKSHGAPVHMGNPAQIGIENIDAPDFGDKVTINDGEIPVFWACGVTSQLAVMNANPALAMTHSPGHMFISDLKSEDIELQ